MQKVTTIIELRGLLQQWRQQGLTIAFVPTMGNLHAGHIKLVTEAGNKADKVIVSIFVNPTQFGVGEDFESYPRTEVIDQEKLLKAGADLLFMPAVFEMYTNTPATTITIKGLSDMHCGAHRVGHFDGVATIVSKLFNIVQADVALFGEKDFQQLAIIKKMVQDLNIPITIHGVATEREFDGLAMSSRNSFLTTAQRQVAPMLYMTLSLARKEIMDGRLTFNAIETKSRADLELAGFKVDYFSICRADNLEPAAEHDSELVILAAAKLGKPRLIDNICFEK